VEVEARKIRADLTVEKSVGAARIIIEDVPEHQLDAIVAKYKAKK